MAELSQHQAQVRRELVRREEQRQNQQRSFARQVPDDLEVHQAKAKDEAERAARQFASAKAFDRAQASTPEGQRWEAWRKQQTLQEELVRIARLAR